MSESVKRAFEGVKLFPFWLDNPRAPAVERELIGPTSADLVVVGGGFTGLWAAIQAKEADPSLDVVLVEAGKVAYGASGRPGGIISTSVMHGLPNATRVFPQDLDVLEKLGQENLDGFKESLTRYGIEADVEWNGEMTVAVDPGHLDHLKGDYELHVAHGHDVVLLDSKGAREQLDSPLFAGAMWSRNRSGTIHPAKLAWGLKAAALKLGVRLHEHSPITRMEDLGATMIVHTQAGRIETRRVLLGTGTADVGVTDIKRRVMQVRDHIIATAPLSDEQMARIGWNNRQGIYDTRTQLNYFRLTKDNRIIFGGRVSYHFGGDPNPAADRDESTYYKLAEAFYRTFPHRLLLTRRGVRAPLSRRQERVRRGLYGLWRGGQPLRREDGPRHAVESRYADYVAGYFAQRAVVHSAGAAALDCREDHLQRIRRRRRSRRLAASVDQFDQGTGFPDVAAQGVARLSMCLAVFY
jgi:glycine/D-amino acid oxidase-like deaminating enzyme